MIIYGIETHSGDWDMSWSTTKLAFATRERAEKYMVEAKARSLELERQIDKCNSCTNYFDQTSDDGKLIIPIEEARVVCPRAAVDGDGYLMCHDSGAWGVPHYNIIEIEYTQEETI